MTIPETDPPNLSAYWLDDLLQPLRDTAAHTARLARHVGGRLDALTLDLARDGGAVVRDAQALAGAVRARARTVSRATPRLARIAQCATALLARQRWLRLARVARTGSPELVDEDHRDLARRAVAYAAALRGGITKLGQLASCRPDLIGSIWASELSALQDDVPPVDASSIRARIEAELGAPVDELFAELDDVPIAAASLAQVHAARLHDGTRVVVKVQVPGIEDVIAGDVAALSALASTVGEVPGIDLPTLADELGRALASELDYAAEARALSGYRGGALVPAPVAERSSARVLTMTRIDGERLTAWLEQVTETGRLVERDRLIGALVAEIAAQVLARGQVHADPHPGNVLVTPRGELALLDFGCVLELPAADRAAYARLVLALAGGDAGRAARELAGLGFSADDPERLVELTRGLVGALQPGARASEIDWQAAFGDQLATARQLGGLVVPRSFVLLGRVLASVAGLLATYRPAIQVHALIAPHLAAAMSAG